ncbi:MAG: putative zinc-binding metallopeptidase [Pseudomonadota bacterium]|nr:putative zinc-binding metallopeptidase [Pseudomonadota bacterium]MEE3098761.1 putative zinc-binding metallopeptidase [Pseudomonadota bacterium]
MRLFACPACGGTVYFRNLACGCGAALAYDPDLPGFVALDAAAPCANREVIGCNWQAEPGGAAGFCRSCAMTETAPDPVLPDAAEQWAEAEAAKRWVLANLARWGWFGPADPGPRPVFHLLAEETRHGPADVIMGHADGVVTINLAEADPAERVKRREDLGEPYRTLPGHFRHELAHFLHMRLIETPAFAEAFRALFGDERADYGAALERHYADGPPADWPTRFVSAYASAHPHEDWAESTAHMLHLTDIVDSFEASGLGAPDLPPGYDAYAEPDAAALVERGCALGLALNHVNRSMGLSDIYPFVLPDPAREKLAFVHQWLRAPAPVPEPAPAP